MTGERERPWLTWFPALLGGGALAAAFFSPRLTPEGALSAPLLLAGLLIAALMAALHRPLGGTSLGLGVLALPLAAERLGAAPAALLSTVALLLADLVRRFFERSEPDPSPERRGWGRVATAAGGTALAALVSAAVWSGWRESPAGAPQPPAQLALQLLAALSAYGFPLVALELTSRRLRGPAPRSSIAAALRPLLLDAGGWVAGALVVEVTRRAGAKLGAGVLAIFALLALEAAREELRKGASERNLAGLQRAQRAGQRIVAPPGGSQLAGLAHQIRSECGHLLAYSWFQFELFVGEEGYRSWWASAESGLEEGEPFPPRRPPSLPGVHRSSRWQILERPLAAEGQLLARIRLWTDPRRLDPKAVELLDSLLPQMAASVRSVILDREARQDPLTGAAFRRVLEQRLALAWEACRESGGAVAVLMCDLDHFKRINDTWGHAVGDRALQAVARLLLAHCRERDLCARYGGEEFTLLLEETNGEEALEIADRLRRRVEELNFGAEGEPVPLTLSVGVAAFPELFAKTPEELLELADAALYEAKRQGRNRCFVVQGPGVFRDAQGKVVTTPGAEPPAAPRIFA